jgi:hypothetical protein
MNRSTLPTILALLSAIGTTGCGDPTTPTWEGSVASVSTADVAVSVGDQIAADVALMLRSEGAASVAAQRARTASPGLALSLAAQTAGAGCTFSDGTQRFDCASATEGSLTVTRSFGLFDDAGAPQAQYDAATTASIDYQLHASGTIARTAYTGTAYTATYARDAHLAVSGLAGDETDRTWNGVGTSTLHAEFQRPNGVRAYDMASADTVQNVVFRVPTSTYAYPLSGRIIHWMSVTQTLDDGAPVTRTASRRVTVTFDGTTVAAVKVGAVDCSYSFSNQRVTCAGQR